ncbi:hypothetical protein [Aneurinibacillus aneurinilyticus]|uniref:Uncharacterized protein n=1 Tax=Aneurinibacillus aneurinilyticus ATCC 12856 TaxID=649747 RepID=U1Y8Z3_ANEAE|nr:hypothetical protein HMPREF0083_04646 [Aneurinibacillus aneurinilyticus ATCC 12856]
MLKKFHETSQDAQIAWQREVIMSEYKELLEQKAALASLAEARRRERKWT